MSAMGQLLNNIKAFLDRLTPNQRMLLSACATAVFIGIAFLLFRTPHLAYVPLYTDLDAVDAAKVVEALETTKVPYQLGRNGTAILVPSDRAQRLRLSFAAQGLPKTGTVGYEIFDKTNLGMTDFIQKVNFRRALEGELTKTIESLEEVSSARVHIVKPEPSLFLEKEKPTTASVMLKLNSSAGRLNREQIQGITYLLASSVEGLQPEHITIVDYSGRMLSERNSDDTELGLSQQQLELQKNVETYLEKKAQSILDGMVGTNRSIVKVSALLNFKKVESTLEQFDPDKIALRSEERTEETGEVGGSKENTVSNYEVNRTVQHVVDTYGNIERLSVAVTIDPGTVVVDDQGNPTLQGGKPVIRQRAQEEIDQLGEVVKSAVGFSQQRGDQFTLSPLRFDKTGEWQRERDIASDERKDFWTKILVNAAKLLGIIAALFILKSIIGAIGRGVGAPPPRGAQAPAVPGAALPAALAAMPEEEEGIAPRAETERQRMVNRISAMVNERPEDAARIIRSMARGE